MRFAKLLKAACCAIVAGFACTASAVIDVDIEHDTSGCVPGKWTSDFAAAKAYCESNNVPMLAFWGSEACAYCARMKSNGLTQDEFKAWVAKKPIVLVLIEVAASETSKATTEKVFIKGDNKSGAFPYMRCYWPKADGSTVSVCFSGRTKYMPVTTGTIVEQLVGTLDKYFGSWDGKINPVTPDPVTPDPVVPTGYQGGYFSVTNLPYSRLEAVVDKTSYVDVPLYRSATAVATNYVQVGSHAKTALVWASGAKTKTYRYSLTATEKATKGAISLKLYDSDGKTVKSTSAINVVADPGVSLLNPKWVGEDFDYGEWTMDYEAAKKKDGYILAEFGGSLWCPDCKGADETIFSPTNTAFYKWAKANKVMLVVFDQGKSTNPATAAGDGTARLLTYAEGYSYNYKAPASGASYLSRKSISASAAKSRIDMTTKYTTAWLAPGSTAARMANPMVVLVKDDKVLGRWNMYEASDRTYDPAENLARLKTLVAIADGDTDDYLKSTTHTLALGSTGSGGLQVNNTSKFRKLTGVKAGSSTFTVTGKLTDGTAIKPTVTVYDAADTSNPTVLATGTGTVKVNFSDTANKYVEVSYFTEAKKYGSANTASYTITSTVSPDPVENEYLGTSFTANVPVNSTSGSSVVTVGNLLVTSTRYNKITVKYTRDASSGTVTMRGTWGSANAAGVATATVSKGSVTAVLSIDADGIVTAKVTDSSYGSKALASGESSVAESDFSAFTGLYTIALPQTQTGKTAYPTGAGYVVVKANTASARKTGKVSCKFFLPTGRSMTVTAYMRHLGNGWAGLSVVKKSGKDSVSVNAKIRPNASKGLSKRAIIALDGTVSQWKHLESGYTFTRTIGVYGSYLDTSASLVDCCGADALVVAYDTSRFSDSERYGAVKSVLAEGQPIHVTVSAFSPASRISGFSVSTVKKQGYVRGKTKAVFANSTKSVTYRAVILPDWHDCGCGEPDTVVPLSANLPFVYGACYYSDRVNGKTVKRGFEIGFEVDED
ncbi:MAG: thioredoxin family protein [Kiritimatiellae bacterium]|nr:thioredoxin family protein [Kiritimatiellia bacterium]